LYIWTAVLHQPEATFWKTATPARVTALLRASVPPPAPEPKVSLSDYLKGGRG